MIRMRENAIHTNAAAGGTKERAMATSGTVATIETQSGPLEIDLAKTAVIVVDMQNDFGAPGGMFARAGIDISKIRATVPPTARVLAAARQAGVKVVYLKMGFQADLSDLGAPDAPNRLLHDRLGVGDTVSAPNGTVGRVLIRNTWNTDILDELDPAPGDPIVYKHRFSGFYETELDDMLKGLGAEYLVFTGCTTSVCVESTIRDAMFRDYQCLLLEDCTAEPIGDGMPRSNHDASVLLLQLMFGWVAQSCELLAALERQPIAS
jgi:ureidoacrylate peracid hydrolase